MLIPDPIIGKAPVYFPTPSQDFIKVFVEEYNKGNVIKWVDIEIDEVDEFVSKDGTLPRVYNINYGKPKINSKNEITIRKIKDCFNRKEAMKLFFYGTGGLTEYDFDKWIEENLS
jgi:hypothetical protein